MRRGRAAALSGKGGGGSAKFAVKIVAGQGEKNPCKNKGGRRSEGKKKIKMKSAAQNDRFQYIDF